MGGAWSVSVSMMELDFFRRFGNQPMSAFTRFCNAAAYPAYCIQFLFINQVAWIYLLILTSAGKVSMSPWDLSKLSQGEQWGGVVFIFSLVVLTLWPIAYALTRMPYLNTVL